MQRNSQKIAYQIALYSSFCCLVIIPRQHLVSVKYSVGPNSEPWVVQVPSFGSNLLLRSSCNRWATLDPGPINDEMLCRYTLCWGKYLAQDKGFCKDTWNRRMTRFPDFPSLCCRAPPTTTITKNFFMLWVRENPRPLFFLKTPHICWMKWSRIWS